MKLKFKKFEFFRARFVWEVAFWNLCYHGVPRWRRSEKKSWKFKTHFFSDIQNKSKRMAQNNWIQRLERYPRSRIRDNYNIDNLRIWISWALRTQSSGDKYAFGFHYMEHLSFLFTVTGNRYKPLVENQP